MLSIHIINRRHAQLKVCVVYYRIRWMRAALHLWNEKTVRHKNIEHIQQRAIRRLRMLTEGRMFSAWRGAVIRWIKQREASQTLHLRVNLQQYHDGMMRSILMRMKHRLVSIMFSRWQHQWRNQRKMLRFVLRTSKMTEARCFDQWSEVVVSEQPA